MKKKVVKSIILTCVVFFLVMTSIPLIGGSYSVQSKDYNPISEELYKLRSTWYISNYTRCYTENNKNTDLSEKIKDLSAVVTFGPMDSPWPMLSHDLHHTGLSQTIAVDNSGFEKWRFRSIWDGPIESTTTVIDSSGFLYFGSQSSDGRVYSLYPNGTLRWWYPTNQIWSTPVIDDTGVLYVGNYIIPPIYLYAIFVNNGTLKWRYPIGGTLSSPVVTGDGIIIFGDDSARIIALYPNGTLKWTYQTGDFVASSAAIGDDGMIYIGSSDGYLYALYPNGTLNWRFGTDGWIKGHPTIDSNGTIYVPSFDGYLYALYPNGTLKWSTDYGEDVASAGAIIGLDGTIYVGSNTLRAFYPENGSLMWSCDIGGNLYGTVPAISVDGIIFASADNYRNGGDLVAVNPYGTVKWKYHIADIAARSSPCIGEDCMVYVGSTWLNPENNFYFGYLFAIGRGLLEAETNGPYYGLINQPIQFKGTAKGGYSPYTNYYWTFGDGSISNEQNPIHTYTAIGSFDVTLTVTDSTSNTSTDTTYSWIQYTNTPPNKPTISGKNRIEQEVTYYYKFSTNDINENPIYYYIDWGDGSTTGWLGPYNSGDQITKGYEWWDPGTFTIRCKAKDPYNAESDWGTLKITVPRARSVVDSLLLKIFENHPFLEKILNLFLKNNLK